ncbi:MAG TPA: CehA/McbA family metallohydrolase [Candidatus Sulfotelmatobacter sp.]|nr:CehA/McbA family metallohydrolase [Candidatus Sulfotelmatobacter sp.]
MKSPHALSLAAALMLAWTGETVGADAVLRARIKDAVTGRQTPCTVTITDAQGQVAQESASLRDGFRCSGEFTKRLPAGPTRIRITRGIETRAIYREVNLAAGETNELTFTLERVANLRQRGWFAGDSHVHMLHGERTVPVDFDEVALTARAEDLQYLCLAQAWNLAEPTPERLESELRRRSTPECWLTWNLEAPKNYYKGDAGRCLGHCWNLGVRGRTRDGQDVIRLLLEASAWDYESSKPTYANFESHQLIHDQGGVAAYSHPARWWQGAWGGQGGYPKVEQMRISNMAVELPLDTLLGPTYDGLDIITGPGEFEANAKAFAIWSLLLNHGYRIAATGSSDACFDRPGGGVPGMPRTYTYIPGAFSLAKAAKAIAAGRTFVTTGPLLIATIDQQPPGSAFAAGPKARELSVEAWASGRAPGGLQRLEILRNGHVWRELALAGKPGSVRTNVPLLEHETAWYCVRVLGPDRQTAVSSAFYFADKSHRPPPPVRAHVHAQVLDAQTGAPVAATLTEVTFSGTVAREGKRHRLSAGEARVSVPGTVRLRASAKGYAPMILSPVLDNPNLVKTVTMFSEQDLTNWQQFDLLKRQLETVELVFRLQPRMDTNSHE